MMGMESGNQSERKILTRDDARGLAEDHRVAGQPDPYPKVLPSLLSAEHIKDYVLKTGAIAPFYDGGGRQSRLKKASYEGRIGEYAYVYNKQGRLESIEFDEDLMVEANSIVFVECDLDFRLPDYIALRFNLQIRHVHRGLLLGTGPLVDPGYWGKLCIPLHNLTDENYSISRNDGLIWVEFTKTTVDQERATHVGRPPLEPVETKKGYWDIREFIERAATPRDGVGAAVPIRSSISKVRRRADNAAMSAKKAQRWVSRIGIGTAVVGAATVVALVFALVVVIQTTYTPLDERIGELGEENADLRNRLSRLEQLVAEPPKKPSQSG